MGSCLHGHQTEEVHTLFIDLGSHIPYIQQETDSPDIPSDLLDDHTERVYKSGLNFQETPRNTPAGGSCKEL